MSVYDKFWFSFILSLIIITNIFILSRVININNILIEESNKEEVECSSSSTGEIPENTNILNEENEILYTFIENIDTFKSLEDAIKASENTIEQIQFLYE